MHSKIFFCSFHHSLCPNNQKSPVELDFLNFLHFQDTLHYIALGHPSIWPPPQLSTRSPGYCIFVCHSSVDLRLTNERARQGCGGSKSYKSGIWVILLRGRSLKKKKINGRKWHIFLKRFFILLFVSKIPKDVFYYVHKWILSTSANFWFSNLFFRNSLEFKKVFYIHKKKLSTYI